MTEFVHVQEKPDKLRKNYWSIYEITFHTSKFFLYLLPDYFIELNF